MCLVFAQDESTAEPPCLGTESDLEELPSSTSSPSVVGDASSTCVSGSSTSRLERLIDQIKNIKLANGLSEPAVETVDVSSDDGVDAEPRKSSPPRGTTTMAPSKRIGEFLKTLKAKREAKDAKVPPTEGKGDHNTYVLPDHDSQLKNNNFFVKKNRH